MMDDWTVQDRGTWFIIGHSAREHALSSAIGYVYVVIHDAWAYYFSSVTTAKDTNHALLWHTMKALKSRGVRWFEIGWMERDGDTAKDAGIIKFKQGFGGVDMPAREAPALCGL
jgi:hypothetical protein